MKDYKGMAKDVLEQRDKYNRKRRKQKKVLVSVLSGLCLVSLIGVGIWHNSIPLNNEKTGAGNIMPGGATVGEESVSEDDTLKKEMQQPAIEEDKEEADETSETVGPDAPVQENSGTTGTLNAYETVWGGSYMDDQGKWVVWLTENTPKNQQRVFEQNATLEKDSTVFKTADYSLAYLTKLMKDISKAMGDGELSFVSTAALREDINRVEVTMTTEDSNCIEKVLEIDTMGGAILIQYNENSQAQEDLLK